MESEYSDDFEEDAGILKRALYVELPNSFDPDKIPETGEEYLHHVMYERSNCKEWVTVDFDKTKFKTKQTFTVEMDSSKPIADGFLPSTEWQKIKLEAFDEFRKYIAYKNCIKEENRSFNREHFISTVVQRNMKPSFKNIINYTAAVKTNMVRTIVDYLNTLEHGQSIGTNVGAWLYSLLSLLQIPLSPDSFSTLRNLSRACLRLRSNLPKNANETDYAPLNLFVLIVGRYFEQFDLADSYM